MIGKGQYTINSYDSTKCQNKIWVFESEKKIVGVFFKMKAILQCVVLETKKLKGKLNCSYLLTSSNLRTNDQIQEWTASYFTINMHQFFVQKPITTI